MIQPRPLYNRPFGQLPIIQRWDALGALLGTELYVVREDLLPFPLGGNKVRKLAAEFELLDSTVDTIITNGGVDSNFCRTAAWMAALEGKKAHLVLHGEARRDSLSLRLLESLGATWDIVSPELISNAIKAKQRAELDAGRHVVVFSGGGHTPAGARAYKDVGTQVFDRLEGGRVYVASGTGATQGGLIAAASEVESHVDVIGVSVARDKSRGIPPVAEAATWAGDNRPEVMFRDEFLAGGYGKHDREISSAVELGWKYGLPLDPVYTGKAFAAVIRDSTNGASAPKTIFWHTGGLLNYAESH